MSKIIKMPCSVKDYKDLAQDCIDNDDFAQAAVYYRSALKFTKSEKEKIKINIELAKMYAARLKYGYSNELMFDVLSKEPNNKEAMVVLFVNYLSLNRKEVASYYYDKAKRYIKSRGLISFRNADDMAELENDLLEELENVKNDEDLNIQPNDFDIEKFLSEDKAPIQFSVINDGVRFDQIVDEVCHEVNEGNFGTAIDKANEALKLNVPNERKKVAYYSKIMCLVLLNYYAEARELAEKVLKEISDDFAIRMLLCQACLEQKDKEALKKAIEPLLEKDCEQTFMYHRIIQTLLDAGLNEECYAYLKQRIKDEPDSYTYNSYLGILYYNQGLKEKALGVFSELNGRYGELSNAKHFVDYIKGTKKLKPIPANAPFGDWKELWNIYTEYFHQCMKLNDAPFLIEMLNHSDDIVYKIKWLSTDKRTRDVFELVSRIMITQAPESKKKEAKQLQVLKEKVLHLAVVQYIDDLTQCHILIESMLNRVEDKIPVAIDGLFYVADVSEIYAMDLNFTIHYAFVQAMGVAICHGEKNYKKMLVFLKNMKQIFDDKDLHWMSGSSIAALFVKTALDGEEISPEFTMNYNEKIFEKYRRELDKLVDVEALKKGQVIYI